MPIKNMDFISGLVAVVVGGGLGLAAHVSESGSGELWTLAVSLLTFGGAALLRWLRRPTDGEPDSTLPLHQALTQLGLPVFDGDSRPKLEQRAREGWVPIVEAQPGAGELVIAVVSGELVVGRWGSPKTEGATHWRRHPPLPG